MQPVTLPSCQVCGARLTMGDPDTVCAGCEMRLHSHPRPSMLGRLWRTVRRVLGGRR